MIGPGRELLLRREIAERCRSCGTCRSVCPLFAELKLESATSRGKVALIRAVLDAELDLTDIFDERLQLCLNCKACVDACPNQVRTDDLVMAARSGLVEAGRLPFVKRFIFRQLLRRGRLLPPVGKMASFFQRVVLRGLPKESAFRQLLPVVGMDRDRTFPEFAPRTFMEQVPEVTAARGPVGVEEGSGVSGGDTGGAGVPAQTDLPEAEAEDRRRIAREAKRVAYFVGCATNLIYPEVGKAVVEALSRSGVDVAVPRGQVCCGTPVFTAGDYVTARELARKNIEVLRATGADAVIAACASGGLTLKREYELTLGIEGGVGMPVFDFAEFLAYRAEGISGDGRAAVSGEANALAAAPRVRVTYHDPCHLSRGQGITVEPRALVKSLPWVEFVEMRDADRCCGGAGSFSMTHYEIAAAVGKHKAEAIREADVDVVVTECPSCVMQLRDMVSRYGVDVTVMSVAELLEQPMGEETGRPALP